MIYTNHEGYSPKGRILLADDEESILLTTTAILKKQGFEIEIARDSQETLSVAREKGDELDLFIIDYKMPGNENMALLKELSDAHRETPIILFTGYPDLASSIESAHLNIFDYIPKVTETEYLIKRVTEAIERHRLQKALRESEQRLKDAMEAARDGLWDWNVRTNQIIVNDQLREMLDLPKQQMEASRSFWNARIHPEDKMASDKAVQDHLDGKTRGFNREFRLKTSSGEYKWVLSRGRIVERDDAGNPLRVVGTVVDISERKAAEEALQTESEINAEMAALTVSLIRAKDVKEISELVLESARKLTESSIGYVGYIDPETGWLICPTMQGDILERCKVVDKDIVFKTFGGLWGWVLKHQLPLMTNTPEQDPRSSGTPLGHLKIERFLSAPAGSRSTLLGQIALANAPRDYTDKDLMVTERLASLFVISVLRMRAEEAERESRQLFEQFTDQFPGAAFIKDSQSKLVYANQFMREDFGGGPWLGKSASDFHSPELAEKIHEDDRRTLEEGPQQLEEALPDHLGVKRIYRTQKFPLNREGKPPLLGGISTDITDLKEIEARLRASEQRLELALAAGGLGWWDWDITNDVVHTSKEKYELLGFGPEADKQPMKWWLDLVHPEDYQRVLHQLDALLENGHDRLDCEYRIRNKAGRWLWVHDRAQAAERDEKDSPVRLTGVCQDITDRKQAEQTMMEAARMDATATLAAGLAHDFNNLLVGVLANVDLLRMEEHDGEVLRMLEEITRSAQKASELTRMMLAYAGGGKYQPCPIDLNECLRDVLHAEAPFLKTEMDVDCRLTHPLWKTKADPSQINQMLLCLMNNAIEALPGKGQIVVSTSNFCVPEDASTEKHVIPPGNYVRLRMSDNGCGMTPGVLNHAQEPFFSTKEQGRGMGLAAVRGIVKHHGGWVNIDSEPGKGTCVEIVLPAAEEEPSTPREPAIERSAGIETILIADDEKTVANVTERYLNKIGYDTLVARTGKEAVEIARTHKGEIHLALIDVCMPELSGPEAYPLLKEARPQMKVILCSGYDPDADCRRLTQEHNIPFVKKPFRMQELLDLVYEELQKGCSTGSSA